MFGHLDINADGYLSLQELYDLEHDQVTKSSANRDRQSINFAFAEREVHQAVH